MGDFFSPPPGYPPPPPEPDSPLPDFKSVGQNIALGLGSAAPMFGWLKDIFDALLRAVATVIGWAVGIAGNVLAYLIRNINIADEAAQSGYADLVASELAALFGLNYNSAALQGVANAGSRKDLGNKVGSVMLQSIFAPSGAASGTGIEPTDAAAKTFLGTVMTMEVEGWLHSFIYDALTYHELEKFGDLKDGIARVLGLGRMSRQVFAPPLKVFVHDPYLALLNSTYRPNHLPVPSAIRQHFRGVLSREDLSRILGRQGWQEQYIDFLINEHLKYLSDADVDYLVSRGTWDIDRAVRYLSEQGWDLATAQTRMAVLHDQRIDKLRREAVTVATEGYVRGDLTRDALANIVSWAGFSGDEQTWTMQVADLKRELHITHLSRGDIETLIKNGLLNFTDLETWAQRVNMPIDEERFLELLVAKEETDAAAKAKAKAAAAAAKAAAAAQKLAAAQAKAAQALAEAPDKGITVSQAEALVVDGIWTFDHLTSYLQARNFSQGAIAAITQVLHAKIAKTAGNQTAASGIRAAAAAKGLNLATTEKAVVLGILSIGDLQGYLTKHGFTADDSNVIVELTQHAIEQQQAKDQAAAIRAAKAGKHAASLAEIEKAVRLGITPIDTYTQALQGAGFDAADVTLLEGILKSQMAADKAAAAKRAAAAAAAGIRAAALPQIEKEVVAGIRPIGDYTAELATLGYSVHEQTDLTKLLQLRVDQAAIAAEKRTAAGTAMTARGLSLTDIDRAVKLGVLTIDDYKAALKAAGFDQHAIDVLSQTLLDQVAKTAGAQQTTNAAAAKLKSKSISLAAEQKAVLEGVKTIDDYKALLTGQGFNAGDVATMAELLQLKVDQAAAAAARHADAEGKATVRGISLAQEEAAVLAGDKTMANYDALLTALGFDAVDRSTLEALLQAKIAAKAGKAGAGAAGGTTAGSSPSSTTP